MVVFWIFTLVSIRVNGDWWNILDFTLSKLGKPGMASHPWIFSTGLIVGGIFMIAHGSSLILHSSVKLKITGASYILLSGVFMILLALFPDGTEPHDFIALSVFLIFYTGNLIYGLGSRDKRIRNSFISIFLAALIGLSLPIWPSLGVLEIYGLALVIAECVLIIFER